MATCVGCCNCTFFFCMLCSSCSHQICRGRKRQRWSAFQSRQTSSRTYTPWRHPESLTHLLFHLRLLMLHLLMPIQLQTPIRWPTNVVHPLQPMATDMAVTITCNHPTPPMPCHPGLTMTWASATRISMGMRNIRHPFPAILPLPRMATHSVWHLHHHHQPAHSRTTATPVVIMGPRRRSLRRWDLNPVIHSTGYRV